MFVFLRETNNLRKKSKDSGIIYRFLEGCSGNKNALSGQFTMTSKNTVITMCFFAVFAAFSFGATVVSLSENNTKLMAEESTPVDVAERGSGRIEPNPSLSSHIVFG